MPHHLPIVRCIAGALLLNGPCFTSSTAFAHGDVHEPIGVLSRPTALPGTDETRLEGDVDRATADLETEVVSLLPAGSTWTYLDDGTDQGTAWHDAGFDDTGMTTPPEISVIRGPYLQMGSPTSAVVRWRTNHPTESWVRWGDTPDTLSHTNRRTTITTEHSITVTNLPPDSTYFYAVGNATTNVAGGDSNHFFATSPEPGTPRVSTIWVLGDSGLVGQDALDVRDAFYSWHGSASPDLLLMLGDNAYLSGTDTEYQAALFEVYPHTLRNTFLWPTLGNHDGRSAASATQTGTYYEVFDLPRNGEAGGAPSGTEAYYSFDYANIHFICLNSFDVDRSLASSMMTWLTNDLASVTSHWMIAFWHHPPYTRGSHNSDFELELVEMRAHFLPTLEEAGVDLVLCGHSHAYERSFLMNGHYGSSWTLADDMIVDDGSGRESAGEPYSRNGVNGAVYAVAGSSSKTGGGLLNHEAMYLSLNELGSLVLTVSTHRLDAAFVGNTPAAKDWFSIIKDLHTYRLTVVNDGPGEVVPGSGTFAANQDVDLTATPSNYHAFSHWSGDLAGPNNPEQILMDADRVVTARFDAILVTHAVPQWWLAQFDLPPNDTAALDDPDVDGAFTWEEFVADTVPTNLTSRFRVTQIGGAPTNTLVFDSSTQRIYTLEFTDHPASNPWTAVPGQTDLPGTGPGQILQDTVSLSDSTRVYRISVELP